MFVLPDAPPAEAPRASAPPVDIGALIEVDVDGESEDGLSAHVEELYRARSVLDARIALAVGRFDARATWARDGARNGPGWVAARTSATHGRAKGDVAIARALRDMPATEAAFGAGRVGREQVEMLIKARLGLEPYFDACEAILVDEVARAAAAAGARFLRRWAAEVRERFGLGDPDTAPPSDGAGVHLSPGYDGTWRLDGTLSTEQGEVLANALDAAVDEMFRTGRFHADDGLTIAERKAVALVELVTRGSRGGDDDGTARPLVVGVLDLRATPVEDDDDLDDDLDDDVDDNLDDPFRDLADRTFSGVPMGAGAGRLPGRVPDVMAGACEAERAGVVDRATVERWLCEGTFQGVVIGADGSLDLGRKVRIATRAQRRALRVRDGHCAFPGCSAPPEACIAHHVLYWENGGPSDLANLVLLCRWHHKVVHDRGFALRRDDDGLVTVQRPDGTPVADTRAVRCDHRRGRPPPPRARDPIDQPDLRQVRETRLARLRIDALVRSAVDRRARGAYGGQPTAS